MTGTVDGDRVPEGRAARKVDAGGHGGGPAKDRGEGKQPDSGAEASDETYYCDLCGSVMLNLHCKLVCETCGYKRDCSDP